MRAKCISDCEGDFRFLTVSKEYETIPMNFDSRDEVIDWMINNQLGRRNLSKETMSYLRGLQFRREKKKVGENQFTIERLRQNDVPIVTSHKLAEQHNVSPRTIERDAE